MYPPKRNRHSVLRTDRHKTCASRTQIYVQYLASACGVTTLHHEFGDDAMEHSVVVVPLTIQSMSAAAPEHQQMRVEEAVLLKEDADRGSARSKTPWLAAPHGSPMQAVAGVARAHSTAAVHALCAREETADGGRALTSRQSCTKLRQANGASLGQSSTSMSPIVVVSTTCQHTTSPWVSARRPCQAHARAHGMQACAPLPCRWWAADSGKFATSRARASTSHRANGVKRKKNKSKSP
jgi:hypothetical protein